MRGVHAAMRIHGQHIQVRKDPCVCRDIRVWSSRKERWVPHEELSLLAALIIRGAP